MLIPILLLLHTHSAPDPVSEDSLVSRISGLGVSELTSSLPQAQGLARGATLLFLAASDTITGKWSEAARQSLDSLYEVGRSPLRAVLLGTAEAIRARDTQKDEIAATLWLGRSFRHLDEGVQAQPNNPLLRIFRINSLVDVPELFHVDDRLKEDCEFLRSQVKGALRKADTGTLMALGSVAWRDGRSREAIALWKLVVARERKGSPDRQTALRKLERSRG